MKVRWLCDSSRWPLVVLSVPAGTHPDDIDTDSFYEEAEKLFARGERFAAAADLRLRAPLNAARRRRYADWMRTNAPVMRRLQVAGASIAENAVQGGIVTAIHWITRPPYPARTFLDLEPALLWMQDCLSRSLAGELLASDAT